MNVMSALSVLNQDQDVAFSFWSQSIEENKLLVSSFAVEETIFGLSRVEVMLVSDDPDIDLDAMIDAPATLTIHHKYLDTLRHFSGIVVEAEDGDEGHHKTAYRVVMLPSLYRLDNGSDCRIFQAMSVEDIVRQIFSENRIEDVEWRVSGNHSTREYCVCYRETHLAFIERILAEEGIYYFFENDKQGKQKLILSDAPYDVPDCKGLSELEYNGTASTAVKGVYCGSLGRRKKLRATKYAQGDYSFKNPRANLRSSTTASQKVGEKNDYEIFDYPGRYKQDATGKTFTQTKLDATRVDSNIIHGVANAPLITAGYAFKLTEHPKAELNHRWRVLTIRHEGTQPQAFGKDAQGNPVPRPVISAPNIPGAEMAGFYSGINRSNNSDLLKTHIARGIDTKAQASDEAENATTYSCAFTAMDVEQVYRPPQSRKPLVDGPQVAIVVGPEGEEIYTDEHGRVKIHFPWDRHKAPTAEDSSCWIRVSQAWGGASYGNVSIPRIGHEVIVEFLEGDPDQPIIIGRTYHNNNHTPYKLPDNKTKMVIRSDTHKSGGGAPKFNEISFEDENGQENMFVHAQKDQTIKILNDRAKRVEANEVQSIGANRSLEVGENAQEKIGGSVNRFVGGGGTSLLGILGGLLVAGMRDGQTGASNIGSSILSTFLQGAATSTVAAEALSSSKAGAFNAAGDHHMQGGANMASTGSSLGGIIGSIMPLSGVANTVIEKFQTDTIGIARSEQIGAYKNTTVGHTMTINVGEEFVIKVGKSRFIMDAEGNVTIVGTRFNFASSGEVNINGKFVDLN